MFTRGPANDLRSSAVPLLGYRRREGAQAALFDEFLSPNGTVRPHWEGIASWLETLGPSEIEQRWSQARRILRDNGVAYNPGTPEAQGGGRAWELNPVPLLIPSDEWKSISAAVAQRARLLNAILSDLYGPRDLLRLGLVPPALVLGNRHFLRPCAGLAVPNEARLIFYAADLARSPDGTWWVISDRTQAPSGAGYALENRIVLSRVFPEIFESEPVARLGHFFQRMKSALEALSPRSGQAPTVVLLTPGRLSETYFEHAYLAQQLDFILAEGQDLTVRQDTVFIRTLDGLQRVDVILRRVDEDYCDPLELRDESLLGVPGLLAAVRAGTVVLANCLGSGVVQCPALGAFLPRLCGRLLGEPLLMPSVATWWCGQEREMNYVLNNLSSLTVNPAYQSPGLVRPVTTQEARTLLQQFPEYYTGQEFVRLSQCPDFHQGFLRPRSVVLRVFAVREGDTYTVMPGGLTHVADEESSRGVLILQGGGTKDTWVEAVEEKLPTLPASRNLEGRRRAPGLTSRLADNLFWLGRYAERAEFTARMARATIDGLSDHAEWVRLEDVNPVIRTFQSFGQYFPPQPLERSFLATALLLQLGDRANAGSLASIIARLRDIMISVRDRVTADAWHIINQLSEGAIITDPSGFLRPDLRSILLHLSALNGVLGENMTHDDGWRFLSLGRRLERVAYSARILAEIAEKKSDPGPTQLEIILEIFDALLTYRRQYAALSAGPVYDLLAADDSNPRSLVAQLEELRQLLTVLPGPMAPAIAAADRHLLRALSELRLVDVGSRDISPLRHAEQAVLDLSSCVTRHYFMHLRTSSVSRDSALPLRERI